MYRISRFYKVGLCFAFFSEFIAIYPLYTLIFKNHGISPIFIAMLLVGQKLSKMLFDLPTGLLADKFGRRSVLILGTILKISMLLLFWLVPCYYAFMLGMILWGIAMSCFFGNESAYIYDFLKIKNHEDKFPKFMGFYYMSQNIATMAACFVGGYLYEIHNLNMAIVLTLFMMLVDLFFALQLPKYTNRHLSTMLSYRTQGNQFLLSNHFDCLKSPQMLFFICLSGLTTAMFLFFFDLNTIIMHEYGYTAKNVSIVVGIVAGLRVVGNGISGFVVNSISIPALMSILASLTLVILFGSIIDSSILIAGISSYLVFFTLVDIVIITKMQPFIASQLRSTIMSLNSLVASIILIILHFLSGYIAEQEFYVTSIINIMSVIFCVVLFMAVWYFYIFDKNARDCRS